MTKCAVVRTYTFPMEVIYIDSLFVLNFIIDYLLCLVSARICGLWLKRPRYAAAALVGAIYSAAVFLPGLGFLAGRWGKLSCATLMGVIAYGSERRRVRCTAVFLAVSAAFGGAVWAISMASGISWDGRAYMPFSLRALAVAFALCYAGAELLFRARAVLPDKPRVQVVLRFLGRESRFMALLDNGNELSDPMTGAAVMIVTPHALRPILGTNAELFALPDPVAQLEALDSVPELRGKFRLIPFSAVGVRGLLPVFRPEELTIDGGREREVLVAVSASAAGDGFDGIV